MSTRVKLEGERNLVEELGAREEPFGPARASLAAVVVGGFGHRRVERKKGSVVEGEFTNDSGFQGVHA